MVNRTIESLPENTNPSDDNWIINTDPNAGNVFQKSRLLDVVKSRYNPSSGWVLRDGTASPYNANAGDKLVINANNELTINPPSSPVFGDELNFINLDQAFFISETKILINGKNQRLKSNTLNNYQFLALIYIDANLGWVTIPKEAFLDADLPGLFLTFEQLFSNQGSNDIEFTDVGGNAVISAVNPYEGGYSLECSYSYKELALSSPYPLENLAFTLSFYFYCKSLNQDNRLFINSLLETRLGSDNNSLKIVITNKGSEQEIRVRANIIGINSGFFPNLNQWYFLELKRIKGETEDTIELLIDGVSYGTNTILPTDSLDDDNGDSYFLGVSFANNSFRKFDGFIDNFSLQRQ